VDTKIDQADSVLRGSPGSFVSSWLLAPTVFALLTLLMFFDVLFSARQVISSPTTDLAMQFIPWREFGFEQLRHGNLPLWNPHIYGGAPYFAGFQSAMLYPPNWLHLIMPVGAAINWIVALHVFFAGYFTYLWCRGRSIGRAGAILAGVMFMFSGPYFLHVYAGHLPHLCVMVWIPLMVLSLDRLADSGDLRWCLPGIAATSLQVLSGHPQYVYYTGIALTIYTALRLIDTAHRVKLSSGFVAMYLGAVLLTAIQLLPGLEAASEQVRSGGTDFSFAAMFSLPPQNLITLVAPTFFGNVPIARLPAMVRWVPPATDYWGTCYLWEMSLFVSVIGLVLGAMGLCRGPGRAVWIPGVLVLITLVLALGRHTPLYRPLFDFIPQYSSFRGTSKFTSLAVLFICLLAAYGLDALIRNRRTSWITICAIAAPALALLALGLWIGRTDRWDQFVTWVQDSGQISSSMSEWYWTDRLADPAFQADSTKGAQRSCQIAAATLLLAGALVWAARFHRVVPYALLGAAAVELLLFSARTRATMQVADAYVLPPPWRAPLAGAANDQRVLTADVRVANLGMAMGFHNLAGYDPGVLKRYAELMFASQATNPAQASQYIFWRMINPSVFRMYRCGLVFYDERLAPMDVPGTLPLALLVSDVVQLDSRELALAYLTREKHDPATTVVLEQPPGIQTVPSASPPGSVHASRRSTDEIEISAELSRPAVLVMTENFSGGWRVAPAASPQQTYRILPANWAQMAIPLEAGTHRFTLKYLPRGFRVGRWVSIFALLGFAVTSFLLMRRRHGFR
jgi:hypothetical protein